MRTLMIICGILLVFGYSGCTHQYSCKEDVQLGMSEQDAFETILNLGRVAEEKGRNEYLCYLKLNCGEDTPFSKYEPFRLTFEEGVLVRIEIDQEEKLRQEIRYNTDNRSGVNMHYMYVK